jgi:CDP-diacylglycerol---serine O-phosphatidyltransferase
MSDLSQRDNPYNVTQASRIYFLPNLMTAGNLFCGFAAVIKCIQARLLTDAGEYALLHPNQSWMTLYTHAVWLILAAVIFDSLDGRLARMGGRTSLFGAEFDSLADVVSFGMTPALMVFFLILAPREEYQWFRELGWLIAFMYLLCGAVRLARFNVITNPLLHRTEAESNKDFVGLPIPAAAGTVASLVLLLLNLTANAKELRQWALALPFILILVSMLMVSTIRYPSFKQINWETRPG